MKNKFTILLLMTSLCLSTYATIHTVFVGQSGLTFSPSSLSVSVGDTVRFSWVSGSHTTTSVSVPSGAATWTSTISGNVTVFDYEVTTAGQYSYKCNPHAGAGMVGTFSATVSSVNDVYMDFKKSFSLAPNPTAGQVTMRFNSTTAFKGAVKVFNSSGELVLDEKLKVSVGDNAFELETKKLKSGLYYVNVLNQSDSFLTEKLIVE